MQIGNKYQNGNGVYTVLAIQGDRLFVEYEDGRKQELSLKLQRRILRSIKEQERARQKEQKRRQSQTKQQGDGIYRNRCWNCQKKINSQKNKRCPTCGWYICTCRACNCNRPKDTGASNLYLTKRPK